jgi:DNA-binding NarL/FixJ family response regulator
MTSDQVAVDDIRIDEVIDLQDAESQKVGVIIVDHRRMVRASMETIISQQPDLEVIGQVTQADEVIQLLTKSAVSGAVVVIDLEAGDGAGLALVRAIDQDFPDCKIVGFGRGEDSAAVARAFYAGVSAFVDANVGPADLIDGIRAAANGQVVVKGIQRHELPRLAHEIEKLKTGSPKLTERECQILQVAAEGLAAQDIAKRIGISVRTVTTHLSHIYSKLGVHSRVAAIAAATKGGYVLTSQTANS